MCSTQCSFSVASDRVGHFIYGSNDKVWPDFHLSFPLFKGDSGFLCDFCWQADQELPEIASRNVVAIKSAWLKSQIDTPMESSSSQDVAKFGITFPPPTITADVQQNAKVLHFGSFSDPKIMVNRDKDQISFGSFKFPIQEGDMS